MLAVAAPSALAASPGGAAGPTTASTASTSPSSGSTGSTGGEPTSGSGGGAGYGNEPVSSASHPTVAGSKAVIRKGVAYAPEFAPLAVKKAIWAGNKIRTKPYIYGGGHQRFNDAGYDCSGSVSYALHGGGLLRTPLDSSSFEVWGRRGKGKWITVYANGGHAFMVIAGIRFDTSAAGDPTVQHGSGPRWRVALRNPSGYVAVHPAGY
jgi:hypothetical protein